MKKVIVYQVNKTEHVVTGDHLELLQYSYDQITPIRDSDEFVIHNGYEKSITLPIQKYVFCQKHWKTGHIDESVVYAAFDEELLKLIQCERDKFENLNDSLISKCAEIGDLKHEVVVLNMDIGTLKADKTFLENECLQLKTKLSKIAQMNWWKRILFIFKGWKYDNGTQ